MRGNVLRRVSADALVPSALWRAWLLVPAYAASFAITLTHTHLTDWFAFGPIYTAIVLYPVWLLGCVLAEQTDALPTFSSLAKIWAFRLGIWFCASICLVLNFRRIILVPQTMAIFGTLAFFWLRQELSYRAPANSPQRITHVLASFGAWSYSLLPDAHSDVDALLPDRTGELVADAGVVHAESFRAHRRVPLLSRRRAALAQARAPRRLARYEVLTQHRNSEPASDVAAARNALRIVAVVPKQRRLSQPAQTMNIQPRARRSHSPLPPAWRG